MASKVTGANGADTAANVGTNVLPENDVTQVSNNGHTYAGLSDLEILKAQRAELDAKMRAAREIQKQLREQQKAMDEAARKPSLDVVILKQSTQRQKWIEETVAGKAIARMNAGQNRVDAVNEVLAVYAAWAQEEIDRRLAE